jgi:hypothetical protein
MCTVMEDWQSVSLLVVLTAALQLQSNFQMLLYSIFTQVTVNTHGMLHCRSSTLWYQCRVSFIITKALPMCTVYTALFIFILVQSIVCHLSAN